jgi:hypothetical protein
MAGLCSQQSRCRFRFAEKSLDAARSGAVVASKRRPMTGPAKQSIRRAKEEWIASSLSLLAMTLPQFPKQDSAISRRDASEFLQRPSALNIRGRRECRAHDAPAASRAK